MALPLPLDAAAMTAPSQTWHYNKKQLQNTAAILFAMALLFGLFGFAHWFGAAMAIFAAAAGIHTLILAADTKPVLTIGPEGLRFARFSARTVPWDRIAEVAVVRGLQRRVAWGKVQDRAYPGMDEINFELKDYDGYSGTLRNVLRGFRTQFGAPGVQCWVAHLDGATAWQRWRYVILPQLRPALVINTVYALIQFLKTFTVVVVMTKGGPNDRTNFVSYYAYQLFDQARYGEATAMATILFAIVIGLSLTAYRIGDREPGR